MRVEFSREGYLCLVLDVAPSDKRLYERSTLRPVSVEKATRKREILNPGPGKVRNEGANFRR